MSPLPRLIRSLVEFAAHLARTGYSMQTECSRLHGPCILCQQNAIFGVIRDQARLEERGVRLRGAAAGELMPSKLYHPGRYANISIYMDIYIYIYIYMCMTNYVCV